MYPLSTDFMIFRWQDAIDIALNSYILFRLYVLFRGTRIFQAILSIAVFWVLQHIATYFGMLVTGWVLRGFMALAAFIIIVVFRDEAFNFLQVKNLRTVLWSLPQPQVRAPIEIITETVFDMAQRRMGGLWVFPGDKSLDGIIRGGIQWDGKISKEMMLSIFWSHNPVHDGAAVVSDDKITQVGMILPLSKREDLPMYYGTRHRAAVGLSEVSDALTLVISEERGKVTTTQNGKIETVLTPERLQEILRDHLGVVTTDPVQERKTRLRLILAALLCVLMVGSAWYGFTSGVETLTTLDIPVEYIGRESSLEIQYASASNVHLQVGGSGPLIRSLRPDQVKVKVDLSHAEVGSNTFPISAENISLPRGVIFKRIEPSEITIHLDRPIMRQLAIQADWTGRLADNLRLTEVLLSPETLNVKGGSHAFSGISTLFTEKVPLDAITRSGSLEAEVLLPQGIYMISPNDRPKVKIQHRIEAREPG
jgi:diadenylate cyclase